MVQNSYEIQSIRRGMDRRSKGLGQSEKVIGFRAGKSFTKAARRNGRQVKKGGGHLPGE